MPAKLSELDDAELVVEIQQGNHKAESELVGRYGDRVLMMLRGRRTDPELCHDIYQDTFIIVIERIRDRGLDEPSKVGRFILRTAGYKRIEYIRRRANEKLTFTENPTGITLSEDLSESSKLIQAESLHAVTKLLEELPQPRDREILRRFYWLQQSKKEILAEFPELMPASFDRIISRARLRFRELMKKHGLHFDARDFGDEDE